MDGISWHSAAQLVLLTECHRMKSKWRQGCVLFRELTKSVRILTHSGSWKEMVVGLGIPFPYRVLGLRGVPIPWSVVPFGASHGRASPSHALHLCLIPPLPPSPTHLPECLFYFLRAHVITLGSPA